MKKTEIKKSKYSAELYMADKYAEIREVKLESENENMIRIFKHSPMSFSFQIRTFKGIGQYGNGKKRNMIATVNLDKTDFEQIVNFVKENFDLN